MPEGTTPSPTAVSSSSTPRRAPRRRLRRLALWVGIPFALLLALVLVARSRMDFTVPPERIAAFFAGRPYQPTDHTARVDGRSVHWVEVGDRGRPTVLFVHGSPGSWDAFLGFLGNAELTSRAHLVAPDRLGFGGSEPGRAEPSLERQAAALMPALTADPAGLPAIVVAHSLGGPIAVQLAVDHPAAVGGLVLVAPSIDPALEVHRWYNDLASWWVVEWVLPPDMVTSNRELWPLKAELEKLLPRWREIRVPVIVIQGQEDALVDPANADFAERMLVDAPVEIRRIPGIGHLIPWEHPDLMRQAILDLLAKRQGSERSSGSRRRRVPAPEIEPLAACAPVPEREPTGRPPPPRAAPDRPWRRGRRGRWPPLRRAGAAPRRRSPGRSGAWPAPCAPGRGGRRAGSR